MGKVRGSITIYLSLALLIMLALVFTLIESARVSAMNAKFKSISFMAADSCFAEYSSEVFEKYGVMALWMKDGEFMGEYNGFINSNLHFSDLNVYQAMNLYPAEHYATAFLDLMHLTDNKGRYFEKQVVQYMKYHLVQEVLERILTELNIFGEAGKVSKFVNKLTEYQDIFIRVGTTISDIQQTVDRAKSLANNPKSILGNMAAYINNMAGSSGLGNIGNIISFDYEIWRLGNGKKLLEGYMQKIQMDTEEYYRSSSEASNVLKILREELEGEAGDYSEETLDSIYSQLDQLEEKTAAGSNEFYNVERNNLAAMSCEGQLSSLDPLLEVLEMGVSTDKLLGYRDIVNYYSNSFSAFDLNSLGLSNVGERVKKENSGFLNNVKTVFTKGLLAAVTTGKISDRKVNTSDFPSKTSKGGGWFSSGQNLASSSMNKLIMGEFVLEHMGCYTGTQDDSALMYETEYIIGGKGNDRDNLSKVVNDLVLLRAGLNMISFMRDSQKMGEAEAIAMAVLGFTGLGPAVEALKMIIISTWCLAESLCDAKALLSGGKVPALKVSHEWTISAVGLKNFSKTVIPAATSDNGYGYEDYLRVLLLMLDSDTLSYRTMDIIQANMCKNYNKDFRMNQCICEVDLQIYFGAKQLFTAFPFVRNLLGNGRGEYNFQYEQHYSY